MMSALDDATPEIKMNMTEFVFVNPGGAPIPFLYGFHTDVVEHAEKRSTRALSCRYY